MIEKFLSEFFRDPVRVPEQRVQGGEFLKEFGRRLFPDAGDAGHVVGRVPRQGEIIHELVGTQAVFFFHFGRGVDDVLGFVQNRDAVVHELEGVIVPGDDQHVEPVPHPARGQGGDQVVGFVPRLDHRRQPPGPDQILGKGQLKLQVGLNLLPVGLVLGVGPVAKGGARRIETDRHAVGAVFPENFDQ